MARPAGPGIGGFHAAWAVLLGAALVGAAAGADLWTTDDAFISFRYAANLLDGKGLVFNAGERVEAVTNFLWTLWAALGLAVGATAEAWASWWGLASYLGAIALLGVNQWWLTGAPGGGEGSTGRYVIPLGACVAAAHRDWSAFATSGLETGAFTFLLLAGFLAVTWSTTARGAAGGGVLLGLAALTRPEGALVAGVCFLFLVYFGRPRGRVGGAFLGGFLPLWLGLLLFRLAYYGDWVPNTYYAKSADLAWWSQGWHYLTLYLEKYWALAFGPFLALLALALDRHRFAPEGRVGRQTVLALAIAGAYTLYVVRIGGDFMFARFLVPVTPFLLVLLDAGASSLFRGRLLPGLAVSTVLTGGVLLTPTPVTGTVWRHGIANERAYYNDEYVATLDRKAAVLRRVFEGLPVRVAFYGSEARVVYKAGFPVAIESHAGLTEPDVARQPLAERGRVGHEKYPSVEYLIDRRRAQITFSPVPQSMLQLRRYIPELIVQFDEGFTGQLLRWDPELVAAIRARGARVPPFLAMLDRYIAEMDALDRERVASDYERFRRFYFDHVDDATRRSAFERRLSAPAS